MMQAARFPRPPFLNPANRYAILFYLFLLSVSVYLLTSSGHNFFLCDASQQRLEAVKSLLDHGDIDTATLGVIGRDGRRYVWTGIGSVLVALPFCWLGLKLQIPVDLTLRLINPLFGAATVVLVYLFAFHLGYRRRTALVVALIYAFASMAWPYAKHPWDNVQEVFFILLSLFLLLLYYPRTWALIAGGTALGFAFLTRNTTLILIPAVLAAMILREHREKKDYPLQKIIFSKTFLRNGACFFGIFTSFFAIAMQYNYYISGGYFSTGYQLIFKSAGIDPFSINRIPQGLLGLLVSPGKGMIFFCPAYLLVLFTFLPFQRRHPDIAFVFFLIIVTYLIFISSYFFWHADLTWGPRYLLVTIPFALIPAAAWFESWKNHDYFMKGVVFFIIATSLVVQLIAVSVDFHKYWSYLVLEKGVGLIKHEGNGVTVKELPRHIYFRESPIVANLLFMEGFLHPRQRYAPLKGTDKESLYLEGLDRSLYMNTFDFWWLHELKSDRNITITTIVLTMLILMFIASALGIRAALRESPVRQVRD